MQPKDETLIEAVLAGNQGAFASLVDRYKHFVFTLTMRYVNNRELAEELSQDVFIKAYRFLADFKGNSKFSTWLYTIVNSICLSHLRNKKQPTIFPGDDKIIFFSDRNTIEEQLTDVLDQKSQRRSIEMALLQLAPTDREIITLFYLAGESVEKIGTIMGLTTSNVKVKLFRGRQKLKEILVHSIKEYQ